jgi:hypothetical protein
MNKWIVKYIQNKPFVIAKHTITISVEYFERKLNQNCTRKEEKWLFYFINHFCKCFFNLCVETCKLKNLFW